MLDIIKKIGAIFFTIKRLTKEIIPIMVYNIYISCTIILLFIILLFLF